MVVPMLVLLLLAVVQIGLALHVHATLVSAAAEGARVAAVSGGDTGVAVRRTREALASSLAADVIESVTAQRRMTNGLATVELVIHARLPLVGLLGPTTLVVRGHAVAER